MTGAQDLASVREYILSAAEKRGPRSDVLAALARAEAALLAAARQQADSSSLSADEVAKLLNQHQHTEAALRRLADVTVDEDATGVKEIAEIVREALATASAVAALPAEARQRQHTEEENARMRDALAIAPIVFKEAMRLARNGQDGPAEETLKEWLRAALARADEGGSSE